MPRIALKDWDLHRRTWWLDLGTDQVTEADAARCHGYLTVLPETVTDGERPRFVAVYSAEGRLWLHAGARLWSLDRVRAVHETRDGGWCAFRVTDPSGPPWELRYRDFAREEAQRLDPTFDGLDEQIWDVFLFVARNVSRPGWRQAVTEAWGEGFAPLSTGGPA